ncbi:MAG: hypothetical protein K2X93_15765 [Candidatus Obscuribacterales bacterium]|nr:hypothetical protein [Candidatus Obscuribacterales bacterium]
MVSPGVISLITYVPAKDFEESKRFYREIGFDLKEAWGGNFDCELGNAKFRLQNYYVKEWADNFMLQFAVEDARIWYQLLKPIADSGRYNNVRVSEPEVIDNTVITHVWDPSGVLLIFVQ